MKPTISLLVVEDTDEKFYTVERLLTEKTKTSVELLIDRASSYDEAVTKLRNNWYDVAILDLLLPMAKGDEKETATSAFSVRLVNRVHSGEFPSSPFLICLTAFENELVNASGFFTDNMLHIEHYTAKPTAWADRISKKICVLARTLDIASLRIGGRHLSSVVILVAQPETEFRPIDRKIKWHGDTQDYHPSFPNVKIKIGNVKFGTDDIRKVILACAPDMGMVASASLTTQLSFVFKPKVFSMLGMCCGFSKGPFKNKLCDVIIAEITACWDEGKYDANYFDTETGYKFRPKPKTGTKELMDIASKYVKTDASKLSNKISKRVAHQKTRKLEGLEDDIAEVPKIKMGKMLSGLSVVSDEQLVDKILKRAPDAVGLEMEIFGVYGALDYLRALDINFIAIKGVADFGIGKDDDKFDPVQPIASGYSYEVLHEILTSYFSE